MSAVIMAGGLEDRPAALAVAAGLTCSAVKERPGSGRLRGNHTHVISQAGALFVMEDTRWDQALKVTGEGEGLVGTPGQCCCVSWPTGRG